jgi:hypothetical protein
MWNQKSKPGGARARQGTRGQNEGIKKSFPPESGKDKKLEAV